MKFKLTKKAKEFKKNELALNYGIPFSQLITGDEIDVTDKDVIDGLKADGMIVVSADKKKEVTDV